MNNFDMKNKEDLEDEKFKRLYKQANDYVEKKVEILNSIVDEYYNLNLKEEEIERISYQMNDNLEDIKYNILNIFDKLFQDINYKQMNENKNTIKYINLSFLKTRLLENKGVFLIEAFDNKFFLDNIKNNVELELNFLYEDYFDNNFEDELLQKHSFYINKNDLKNIKIDISIKYIVVVANIIGFLIDDIVKLESFELINKENNMKFLIGEYRAKSFLIYNHKI